MSNKPNTDEEMEIIRGEATRIEAEPPSKPRKKLNLTLIVFVIVVLLLFLWSFKMSMMGLRLFVGMAIKFFWVIVLVIGVFWLLGVFRRKK